MSQTNSNHDPVPFADLPNRLMDCPLAEMIGGETPPDLTSRILARSEAIQAESPTTVSHQLVTIRWTVLATAAAISLIAVTVYLFSTSEWRIAGVASYKLDRAIIQIPELLQQRNKDRTRGWGTRTHRVF